MLVDKSLCQTQKETSQTQKEISQNKETMDLNISVAIKVLENVKTMLQFIKKPGRILNNQERFIRIMFTLIASGDIQKNLMHMSW